MITRQIYGRADAVALVRELMERPLGERDRPTTRRYPAVVFEAPAGGGKTALLDAMAKLLHQRVPYAHLNLATVDAQADAGVTLTQLLSALAFELAHRCRRYGRLHFPRFVVGQLVMGLNLSSNDPDLARRQVTRALKAHRRLDQTAAILQDAAGAALKLAPIQPQVPASLVRTAVSLLVDGVVRWFPGLTLGRYQDWYGHRDRGLADDPIGILVDLNRWACGPVGTRAQWRIDNLMFGGVFGRPSSRLQSQPAG